MPAKRNVLVIGDLHAPFTLKGYREFCYKVYQDYQCNQVIFIGDIVDHHFSSFHTTDADGMSAIAEQKKAIKEIQKWYKLFPEAIVTIGNHDLIPSRKLFEAGVSQSWIRPISEVLEVPNWKLVEEYEQDGVLYCHGTGRKAKNRMRQDFISVVQGHYHSESYIDYSVGIKHKLFALQIGCGIDRKTYAMAYGRHFAKPHINCGVVLDNGTQPLLVYMEL